MGHELSPIAYLLYNWTSLDNIYSNCVPRSISFVATVADVRYGIITVTGNEFHNFLVRDQQHLCGCAEIGRPGSVILWQVLCSAAAFWIADLEVCVHCWPNTNMFKIVVSATCFVTNDFRYNLTWSSTASMSKKNSGAFYNFSGAHFLQQILWLWCKECAHLLFF